MLKKFANYLHDRLPFKPERELLTDLGFVKFLRDRLARSSRRRRYLLLCFVFTVGAIFGAIYALATVREATMALLPAGEGYSRRYSSRGIATAEHRDSGVRYTVQLGIPFYVVRWSATGALGLTTFGLAFYFVGLRPRKLRETKK